MRKGSVRSGLIRRGDYIYHGDKIITGQVGSASFIMIYEDTSIRVYNNSVFRLVSERYSLLNHSELALFEGNVIIEADDNLGYSIILNTLKIIGCNNSDCNLERAGPSILIFSSFLCITSVAVILL